MWNFEGIAITLVMEGTTFACGNLKLGNGGNNKARSSGSESTATQGQAMDDEDGRQDGDPWLWDPPPDHKQLKDSQESSPEVVKGDLENIKEGQVSKPQSSLFARKASGKLTRKSSFPFVKDISDNKMGKLAIEIPDLVIDHSISLIAFSLVGKFVGPRSNIEDVRSFIKRKWRTNMLMSLPCREAFLYSHSLVGKIWKLL